MDLLSNWGRHSLRLASVKVQMIKLPIDVAGIEQIFPIVHFTGAELGRVLNAWSCLLNLRVPHFELREFGTFDDTIFSLLCYDED